ncbi:type I secretion system permease/ATPase [Pokkaliibacter sp. CJK22405]|uniref:type I secretion system permease/ATPase n=1 Tax=Pokkaliibacter sp. CJK22405 TaxID=3384615 RepID=UPI00398480DA
MSVAEELERDNQQAVYDPLLDCLLVLCRRNGIAKTRDQLITGLPIKDQRLSIDLFARAAERAGLKSHVARGQFDQISALSFPVILMMKDGDACVMVEKDGSNAGIIFPAQPNDVISVELEELKKNFSGVYILARKEYRASRNREVHQVSERHWFWGTLERYKPVYRDVLIGSLFINMIALISPLFTMNVYDRVVPNQAFDTLWVLALGMGLAYIMDFTLKSVRAHFLEVTGKKIDVVLSSKLFEQTLNLKLKAKPGSVGSYASNLREFDSVRNFFTSASMVTLIDFPFSILALITIGWISPWMMIVPGIAMPMVFLYGWWVRKPIMAAMEHVYSSGSQKNAVLIESLTGLETLRILGGESWAQRKWEAAVAHSSNWGIKAKAWTSSVGHVSAIIQQFATICTVIVGVYLISEQEMSMGGLIASVILTTRAILPMAQAAGLLANYQQTQLSLNGLEEIMKRPVENDPNREFVERQHFDGDIEFINVSFTYPDQEQKALEGINLKINKGEKVAVIGKIGSGKSTLGRLIMGLYEPEDGSVRIDGIDTKQISISDLRRGVGFVPQDITLFSGTLKENLLVGSPMATDSELIRASVLSGVSEFVNLHPKGFDMMVGERGEGLSGGQRQCIGLARALISDPAVYVLDEPTNAMDSSTEERFKKQLSSLLADKTLVLVTHKSSLLSLVDRVVIVHQGKIVADGPKDAVLEALKHGRLKVG